MGFNFSADIAHPEALQAPQVNPTAKPGGLKGFLINNLPGIVGGIGAVGGEILDPFGGGIVTSAAGSAAGEALKEKLLGQSISPKQIAIQAGESAALGGLGKSFGALRGAAKTALSAAPEAVDTAESVAKPTIGQKLTSNVINKGQQTLAKLGSYAPGQRVAGQQLSSEASQRIGQTLQNEGISALSAPDQLDQVEGKLQNLNKARSALVDANNTQLTDGDKQSIRRQVQNQLSKTAGGTANTVQGHAANFLNEATNAKNVSDLTKYKTSLDNNSINWASNPASVEPGQQLAAKTVRGVLKNVIEQKVPGISDINDRASNLHEASGALKNASARLANLTTGGEGLWGRLLSGETAEKGKALLAKGAVKAGQALSGAGADATGVAESASKPILGDIAEGTSQAADVGSQVATTSPTTPVTPAVSQPTPSALIPSSPKNVISGEVINPVVDPNASGPRFEPNTAPQPSDTTAPLSLGDQTTQPIAPATLAPDLTTPPTDNPNTPLATTQTAAGTVRSLLGAGVKRYAAPVLAKPGKTALSIAKQIAGRDVSGLSQGLQPQNTSTANVPQLGTSSLNTPGTTANTSTSGTDNSENSTYPEANMLYDIERDPTHASTYETLYKTINPAASADSLSNLTTNQKNQLTGSQNAIAALQGYMTQIEQLSSGASGPVGGSVSAILGKYGLGGQQAANAYSLDSSSADVATQIAAGLSPTGRGTASLIQQVKESLPKVTDSSEAAQAKVTQLVQRLQAVMQTEATPLSTYVSQ